MQSPARFVPDVMLLAAGLGRRMLPLSHVRPKPLIELGEIPLIDRVIDAAMAEGCKSFALNSHYLAEKLEKHVEKLPAKYPEASFTLSPEPELLGTGGGLKQGMTLLASDPVLVMNTDSFWLPGADTPIARMAEVFDAKEPKMVLLCVHPRNAVGFRRSHDFCLDPRGRVTLDSGAPVIYAGVALVSRTVFDGTPDGAFSFYPLIEQALEAGELYGVALNADWLHVGDPEALLEAGRHLAGL